MHCKGGGGVNCHLYQKLADSSINILSSSLQVSRELVFSAEAKDLKLALADSHCPNDTELKMEDWCFLFTSPHCSTVFPSPFGLGRKAERLSSISSSSESMEGLSS